MSATMNTILIIGGTSGIGEAFARRWHSMGKKVILTGRRQDKLLELEKILPGTGSFVMDNTDLPSLPGNVDEIFKKFPGIDTVWINSGAASMWSCKDVSSTTDPEIIQELTLNMTAPSILARYCIPKLLAQSRPTHFITTGSGMGFVPNGMFPTYAATKAYIHHFLVGLRQSLKDTNISVIELVPPMVKTDFNNAYADLLKNVPAMTLEEYVSETFEQLDNSKAEDLREVAAGSAKPRVDAWRESIGNILAKGMGG